MVLAKCSTPQNSFMFVSAGSPSDNISSGIIGAAGGGVSVSTLEILRRIE